MKKTLYIFGATVLSLLLIAFFGSRLVAHHVNVITEFSENVPKNSYFEDVVSNAEKLYFVKVSVSGSYYWEEEATWLAPSVDIVSSIHPELVSCSIDFFPETTTGEYTCSSLGF